MRYHLIILELQDKPVLDLIIDFNKSTRLGMRRWSDGKPLPSKLTRLELAPGMSKSIEMDWIVAKNDYGPMGISAPFFDRERAGGVVSSVLIEVGRCIGAFGS